MVAHLNDLRFDDIARRLSEATPGPWRCTPGAGNYFRISHLGRVGFDSVVAGMYSNEADATFIAHARDDIEFLLSLLSEYRHEAAN